MEGEGVASALDVSTLVSGGRPGRRLPGVLCTSEALGRGHQVTDLHLMVSFGRTWGWWWWWGGGGGGGVQGIM